MNKLLFISMAENPQSRSNTCVVSVSEKKLPLASHRSTLRLCRQQMMRQNTIPSVYHQVQAWPDDQLKPEDWGWRLSNNGQYDAIKMDGLPAPDSSLRVVRCKYKGDCQSIKCKCKKHGLECMNACGDCKGTSCANSPALVMDQDEIIEEMVLYI